MHSSFVPLILFVARCFDLLVSPATKMLWLIWWFSAVVFCFGQAVGRADAEVAAELRHWRGAREDARAHHPRFWRAKKVRR